MASTGCCEVHVLGLAGRESDSTDGQDLSAMPTSLLLALIRRLSPGGPAACRWALEHI